MTQASQDTSLEYPQRVLWRNFFSTYKGVWANLVAHCGRSRWLRKKLKIGTTLYNHISNNIFFWAKLFDKFLKKWDTLMLMRVDTGWFWLMKMWLLLGSKHRFIDQIVQGILQPQYVMPENKREEFVEKRILQLDWIHPFLKLIMLMHPCIKGKSAEYHSPRGFFE